MTEHTKIKNKSNETVKAGCVVVNDDKEVLLIGNSEGKIWAFPKGHAENRETLEEVALREVKEETGYEVEILKRLSDITYAHGLTDEPIRVAMFKAKPTRKAGDGEKDLQSAWFSINKAKEIISYKNLAFLFDELE